MSSDFKVMGRGFMQAFDHPELLAARKAGDFERVERILAELRNVEGKVDTSGYVAVGPGEWTENLIVLEGKKRILDFLTTVVDNDPTTLGWYVGIFQSDDTPTLSWDGDWGAVSGGDATEFIDYDEATRQEILFDAAVEVQGTSRVQASNSTLATITVSTGVVAQAIYGVCISDNATKQYAGGASKLLSALRFAAPKTLSAGEVRVIGYTIYIP